MDLSNLALLQTETLLQMQEEISKLLSTRVDTTPRTGRVATFEHEGRVITVVIDRVNPKTISCTETGASVSPGRRWKVGRSLLKVEPVEINKPTLPRKSFSDRPTQTEDAW